ncbi:MAG: hypothetical protein DWI54_03810 [Chloroflexi bacterium]|nr:MAG: hypothetical protein DWI55_06730 [Chloroflexota bacterium]RLT31893.1 MAG: hypothetical protein DWI54_03810 [Chloroflexota bacterium]
MSTISHSDMSLLQAMADNELPADQSAALRARFGTEPMLADAFSELAMMRELLHDMPAARPARSLRLDAQTMQQARGWRWWLISPPGGQFLPALGVAACLCVALLFGSGYDQVSAPDQLHLKGSVAAPMLADAPAEAAPADDSRVADASVPLVAQQPEPSMLPLLGVTAGLVGTVGSARWLMRLRKIQRKAV